MKSIDEFWESSNITKTHSSAMPLHVNLDALIPREDLEIVGGTLGTSAGADIGISSIMSLSASEHFMQVLKKPDFQRETSNWTPQAVAELVKNFLDEELVPAVILWKSPSKDVFVIDGAHRLSALIAYVNNDYGYGNISRRFFKGEIPAGQIKAAKETEQLVNDTVGSYASLLDFVRNGGGTSDQIRRGKNIATVRIPTQSIPSDAKHAEASFFKINQGGVIIDESEIEIIRARNRPEAIAARAILRGGRGHEYWQRFDSEKQAEVCALGEEIQNLLYWPPIDSEWRTFDLPVAGTGYSPIALKVIYELIHIANSIPRERPKSNKRDAIRPLPKNDEKRDESGDLTLERLRRVRRAVQLVMSREDFSLGLHPAVYSYSITGRFQPAAFFAQIEFFIDLEKKNQLLKFSGVRAAFEDFLVKHKYFTNQLVNAKGALTRSSSSIKELLGMVYSGLLEEVSEEEIEQRIISRFTKLKVMEVILPPASPPEKPKKKKGFSKNVKTAARLHAALAAAPRCEECGARMHSFGNTVDHKERQADGGNSQHSNQAQLMHPFCNSGFKEHRHAKAQRD